MNSLTRTFKASTYALLVVSALILAHAEGTAFPQGATLPLAILAWIFNERRGVLKLPLWAANGLGLTGFVVSISEMVSNSLEARLLAGAHLLVYLSWVVLFQPKQARQYWWMCALSMLQVAVGAVLTTSPWYGALLFAFFAAAIWTLSLFTIWQAQDRVFAAAASAGPGGAAPESEPAAAAEIAKETSGSSASPFAALQGASVSLPAVQHEPDDRWLVFRFFTGTAATSAAAVFVSGLFFILIPRMWVGAPTFGAEASQGGAYAITGFSEKVRLGDIGRIMESTEPVLVMKLTEHPSGRPVSVEEYARKMGWDELMFRGAVLHDYSRGHWNAGNINRGPQTLPTAPPRNEVRIRQDITLQPIGTQFLLAMHPVSELKVEGFRGSVTRLLVTSVILRPDRNSSNQQTTYSAFSPLPGIDKTDMTPLSKLGQGLRGRLRSQLTHLPPSGLGRLAAEARRVAGVTEDGVRPTDQSIADRLVHYLRDSGQFSYSLDASIKNPSLDPVEDFLFERKRGHCEYYASALALMLRAADIPSRLISGFKGGKVNSISGTFEVEQRHAHAWVEAYLDDHWETLDATPAEARIESVESLEANLPGMRDLFGYFRDMWNQYIVNMNIAQQRDRFYAPLQEATGDLWEALKSDGKERAGLLKTLWQFLTSPEEWFSWKGGVISFILLLGGAVCYRIGKKINSLLRAKSGQNDRGRLQGRTVEFYERFRKICAAQGLERRESQTQREFGADVRSAWSPALEADGLGGVPSELSELFYRVRFGDHDLAAEELNTVEDHLARLESSLADAHRGRNGNGAK